MAAVTRFEDLVAWQKARALAREIYVVTRTGGFARDYDHQRQIRRAAVSVMANIAEGFERNRPTEFLRYLDISRGSAAEILSHLFLANDVGYIDEDQFDALRSQVDEVSRLLRGLRQSVERRGTASSRNSELGTRNLQAGHDG
jgi:four helix bundle protein